MRIGECAGVCMCVCVSVRFCKSACACESVRLHESACACVQVYWMGCQEKGIFREMVLNEETVVICVKRLLAHVQAPFAPIPSTAQISTAPMYLEDVRHCVEVDASAPTGILREGNGFLLYLVGRIELSEVLRGREMTRHRTRR